MLSPQTAGRELDLNVLNDLCWSTQLLPNAHPMKSIFLVGVGDIYMESPQYQSKGTLDKVVNIYKDSMLNARRNDTRKRIYARKYGVALLHRFERQGIVDDINKSVSVLGDAMLLTPDGHPDKLSSLSNLGISLMHRFERLGDLSDLNTSVSVNEDAVRLTPDGHPDKPSLLNNLGSSLFRHFERLGDLSNLNTSVSVFEDAVRLTPDGHPNKPSLLNNLGNSLLGCFEHLGDLSNLNTSVSVKEDAVRLTPAGHPNKPSWLNNLGNSLLGRFEHLGDLSDINTSISVFEDAVQLTPDGHPDKPSWLNNLGNSLLCRFEHLKDPSDIKMAGTMFEKAAKSSTGSSSVRFHACCLWATYCRLYDPCLLLDAYILAFHLLPTMAWLGLSIADRQHFLQKVGPILEEAVSAAIEADLCETAIEWMDQGHSIIWGQLLQLRTPVDDLRQYHPDIADRFTMLSKKLEGAGTSDNFEPASNNLLHQPSSTSENYHELADKRDKLVQHIRGLDGFHRFLLPRTFSQLQMAAHNGPVISINVSKFRCDALIIMPDLNDILQIPLKKFTHQAAEELYQCLRLLLESKGRNILHDGSQLGRAQNDTHISNSGAEAAFERILFETSVLRNEDRVGRIVGASGDPENELQKILADLWHTVVKPILNGLAISVCCYII